MFFLPESFNTADYNKEDVEDEDIFQMKQQIVVKVPMTRKFLLHDVKEYLKL